MMSIKGSEGYICLGKVGCNTPFLGFFILRSKYTTFQLKYSERKRASGSCTTNTPLS